MHSNEIEKIGWCRDYCNANIFFVSFFICLEFELSYMLDVECVLYTYVYCICWKQSIVCVQLSSFYFHLEFVALFIFVIPLCFLLLNFKFNGRFFQCIVSNAHLSCHLVALVALGYIIHFFDCYFFQAVRYSSASIWWNSLCFIIRFFIDHNGLDVPRLIFFLMSFIWNLAWF